LSIRTSNFLHKGVIISLIIGILTSYAVFLLAKAYESLHMQSEFNLIAESYAGLISSSLKQKKISIQGLNIALENELILGKKSSISRDEFNLLANILDWTGSEILAAAWVPLVKGKEKKEIQLSAGENHFDDQKNTPQST